MITGKFSISYAIFIIAYAIFFIFLFIGLGN